MKHLRYLFYIQALVSDAACRAIYRSDTNSDKTTEEDLQWCVTDELLKLLGTYLLILIIDDMIYRFGNELDGDGMLSCLSPDADGIMGHDYHKYHRNTKQRTAKAVAPAAYGSQRRNGGRVTARHSAVAPEARDHELALHYQVYYYLDDLCGKPREDARPEHRVVQHCTDEHRYYYYYFKHICSPAHRMAHVFCSYILSNLQRYFKTFLAYTRIFYIF